MPASKGNQFLKFKITIPTFTQELYENRETLHCRIDITDLKEKDIQQLEKKINKVVNEIKRR